MKNDLTQLRIRRWLRYCLQAGLNFTPEGGDMRHGGIWRAGLAMLALAVLLAGALTLGAAAGMAQDEDIVASLQNLTGKVNVVQKTNGETVMGRIGLLLRAGDTVVTADQARATIKFRDGSEIRLFQNTRFVLQGSKESAGNDRSFKLDLLLKAGSLWGNFVKQRQTATLTTPTATIGIKGTTLRVSDEDNKARVSLSEGVIDVKNDAKTVELNAGQLLTPFGRSDDLAKDIQPIPFKVDIKADKRQLTFDKNQPEPVFINLQLINVSTGREVARSAKIYFRSNYDRVSFPANAQLDERGFARVSLNFAPPEPSDGALNGNVFVWAVVDQSDADDVGEGRALFSIPVPAGSDKIRVDANKGETKRMN
jgi:FecR protein